MESKLVSQIRSGSLNALVDISKMMLHAKRLRTFLKAWR